jgi:hypothetical protein
MKQNLAIAQFPSREDVSEEAIREQLSRIVESAIFAQSERLSRFLRFTVETTLAGGADQLKEYLIGTEVYDRKPPYHPNVDSIVRSEARRLRSKLKDYYESYGKADLVFIYYRIGSYVPVFRRQRSIPAIRVAAGRALSEVLVEELVAQAAGISVLDQIRDVQIVFEGTLRISRLRTKSPASGSFKRAPGASRGNLKPSECA